MTIIIINWDDFQEKNIPETPMEAALKAVKEYGKKYAGKSVEEVDALFEKYQFGSNEIPPTKLN